MRYYRAMKVLIVDDDEDIRNILKHAIAKEEFEVTTASSVAEALQDLAKAKYDIVLTDLQIDQDAGGFELTTAIHERFSNIDVIMLTGYPTMDAVIKAFKIGVYDYLNKPIDIKLVKAALLRCKEKRLLRARLARSEGSMGEVSNVVAAISHRLAGMHEKVKAVDFGAEHESCRDFAERLLLELDHTLKDLQKVLPKSH